MNMLTLWSACACVHYQSEFQIRTACVVCMYSMLVFVFELLACRQLIHITRIVASERVDKLFLSSLSLALSLSLSVFLSLFFLI